jgi:hypothetical protein
MQPRQVLNKYTDKKEWLNNKYKEKHCIAEKHLLLQTFAFARILQTLSGMPGKKRSNLK